METEAESQRSHGPTRAFGRVWATLLEGIGLRAELVSIEFQQERARFVRLLCWLGAIGVSAFFALLFLNGLVVWVFWATHPAAVLGGMAIFYLLLSVGLGLLLMRSIRRAPPPFESTLDSLRKDRDEEWGA